MPGLFCWQGPIGTALGLCALNVGPRNGQPARGGIPATDALGVFTDNRAAGYSFAGRDFRTSS